MVAGRRAAGFLNGLGGAKPAVAGPHRSAREADFTLGALQVRPSRRELLGDGERRLLQRRVMQVLVALAHPTAEVVSHDELILRCWGGLSVSEDAIGRCIGQLRCLAAQWSEPPFEIETIAGVGYRLSISPERPSLDVVARRRASPIGWIALIVGLVAGVLIFAGVWAARAWISRPAPLATPVVMVRELGVIGDDPALRPFAARAGDSIASFLGDSEVRVVSEPATRGAPNVQLAFNGSVSSEGDQLRLHLFLEDMRSGTTLWSRDFVGPRTRSDALIDEAKGGAMETMNLVRATYGQSGPTLDPETMLLEIRGGEDTVVPTFANFNDALRPYEQALARRPDSGVLRAAYANALATAALNGPPTDRPSLFRRARLEAERTIREHPEQSGVAYLAELVMAQAESPRDWVGAEARLDAALKAAPEDAFLYADKCRFLVLMGRARDSFYYCQRALSLRPHTGKFLLSYAMALDMQGDFPQVADQLLDEAAALYPGLLDVRAIASPGRPSPARRTRRWPYCMILRRPRR